MSKYSRNVGSKKAFIECQLKAAWPNPMSLSALAWFESSSSRPKAKILSLSVRSEILLYRSVVWIKYVFFDCAMPLAVGFSASPQAKILLLGVNLRQIHRQAILRTGHPQHSCLLALLLVALNRKISGIVRKKDEAARKWACVSEGVGREGMSAVFKLNGLHRDVMFVTKRAKVLSHFRHSHSTSLDKLRCHRSTLGSVALRGVACDTSRLIV